MKTAAILSLMLGAANAAVEWQGIFKVADTKHTWSMQKVKGKYADPKMKLVIIPTTTPTEAGLEALEKTGKSMIEGSCPDTQDKATIKPAATGSCYNLVVNAGADDTTYTIDTTGLSGVAFFAQHVPTEFEREKSAGGKHYFYDSKNTDIEPIAQESAGGHAGHDHDHAHSSTNCECEARKEGWKIDCGDMKPVTAAVKTLTDTCTTAEKRKKEECHQAYRIFQAHHDYCPHDTLPATLEGILHVHEKNYKDEECTIHRKFDKGYPNCEAVTCTDKAGMEKATQYLYDNCNTCTSTDCTKNFRTVLMAHDTCAENQLPSKLELGLHDYEEKCEKSICNTADKEKPLSSISCPGIVDKRSGSSSVVVGSATLLLAIVGMLM